MKLSELKEMVAQTSSVQSALQHLRKELGQPDGFTVELGRFIEGVVVMASDTYCALTNGVANPDVPHPDRRIDCTKKDWEKEFERVVREIADRHDVKGVIDNHVSANSRLNGLPDASRHLPPLALAVVQSVVAIRHNIPNTAARQ